MRRSGQVCCQHFRRAFQALRCSPYNGYAICSCLPAPFCHSGILRQQGIKKSLWAAATALSFSNTTGFSGLHIVTTHRTLPTLQKRSMLAAKAGLIVRCIEYQYIIKSIKSAKATFCFYGVIVVQTILE